MRDRATRLPPRFGRVRMMRISKAKRWNYELPAWGVDRRVWMVRPEVLRRLIRMVEKSPDALPWNMRVPSWRLRGVRFQAAPFATRPMRGILRPGATVAPEEARDRVEEDDMLAMIRGVTGKARSSARAMARRQAFGVPAPRPFGYGRY